MATFTGTIGPDVVTAPGDGWPSIAHPAPVLGLFLASDALLDGDHDSNLPVSSLERTFTGNLLESFGFRDFFNRIHFNFLSQDLGNVVTAETFELEIWNAYVVERELTEVTDVGGEGITLTPPSAYPITFAPQQLLVFDFSVSTDGPPQVAAVFTFDFDTEDVDVSITGSRVTAWTFLPDWSQPMTERLEWLTAVMRSYDGREQRQALRQNPRRYLEFSFVSDARERQYLEAVLWRWGARSWCVPFWPDGDNLAGALPAGSTTISVSTTDRDYHQSGLAIILRNPFTYEVVEIESLTGSQLTLLRPTLQSWQAGDRILPARIAQLPQQVSVNRFTGSIARGVVRFQFTDLTELTVATGEPAYRGSPVLEHRPNWAEDPRASYERKLSWLDASTGPIVVDDHAGMPMTTQSDRWLLASRAEVAAFRRFLSARKGRQGAIWVPTWAADLTVKADIGALSMAIDVGWTGYERYLESDPNRKDLRIELADGTVFYRRVTAVSQVDATTERLSIDSALGEDVDADDVVLVSFMALCRLDADGVELAHYTGESAQAAAGWTGVRHDV